jgi:dTDP-4-dehydrorhamnose 3,5-epimerase
MKPTLISRNIIDVAGGNVRKILQSSDVFFHGFGEAYISEIEPAFVKGWKKHTKMTSTLFVPFGHVRFVTLDQSQSDTQFHEYFLSNLQPEILQIHPNTWFAFQGLGEQKSIILNIADVEHEPGEAINSAIEDFEFNWEI